MSRKKTIDRSATFQSVRGAAEITGLSRNYILQELQKGNIPHIRVGKDYRINMPLFLAQLESSSAPIKGG